MIADMCVSLPLHITYVTGIPYLRNPFTPLSDDGKPPPNSEYPPRDVLIPYMSDNVSVYYKNI